MDKPKISVVIPVYNGAHFIQRSLNSVLAQDRPAHEILVIDDGSTDDTPKVLATFKDRIITRRIPNSGGPSEPRNTGIRLATGDYIAFLDADDIWFRNRLSVAADHIARYPDIGFFSCDYAVRYEKKGARLFRHSRCVRNQRSIFLKNPIKKPYQWLLHENFVGTPSAVVVKKAVAQQAGLFDADCRMVEDLDFYLRVAMITDFIAINQMLLYKHNHPFNMSFDKIPLYLGHREVLTRAFASQEKYLRSEGFMKRSQEALADIDYNLGNLHFDGGKKAAAFRYYHQALKDLPAPGNCLLYLWTISKKMTRTLTGDRFNRSMLPTIKRLF